MSESDDIWVPAICGRCYGNCGIRVHRVNGVAVKIEGMTESDMGGRGGVCGKGVAGLQVLYDPNRLNVPLRRTNPEKGLYVDPKWKEITWDEALDEIAAKLGKILQENPKKLLCQWSVLRSFAASFPFRPFYALGVTDMWVGGGGLHCGAGAHSSAGMVFSSWFIVPDFNYTKYVLYFGSSRVSAPGTLDGSRQTYRQEPVHAERDLYPSIQCVTSAVAKPLSGCPLFLVPMAL